MPVAIHSLIWLRNDLRIYDNPALFSAVKSGPCAAIYLLTPQQWDIHDVSPVKRAFIVRHLRSLEKDLSKLNIPLIVLNCGHFSKLPNALLKTGKALQVKQCFYNHEYELNESRCADQVKALLNKSGIECHAFHDQCIVQPGQIKTKTGDDYKVFTAFKRAFIASYRQRARKLIKRPAKQAKTVIDSDLSILDKLKLDTSKDVLWPVGESTAHAHLKKFIDSKITHYQQRRDIPSVDATSILSHWLSVGALSTTQCLHDVLQTQADALSMDNSSGAATWISELIWREFYRHLLVAFPDLCRNKPFIKNTDKLPWNNDEKKFAAWCAGQTGYPLVDAAMRQLNTTGWMHNRLRMVTAMFLSKHLFLDWRLGEKYFMQNLIDGDLASNNGGWQWSASTGVDAVPYFRIFNPTRQSQRFDPEGTFIRKYVPELSALDNKSIHQPSAEQIQQCNYYPPLVEHAKAVAETRMLFKNL